MKKSYETPKLKVFGGVETLTQGFGGSGGYPDHWGDWWQRLWHWFFSSSQTQTNDYGDKGSGEGCNWGS